MEKEANIVTSVPILAEQNLDSESLYRVIAETLDALSTTYIDGHSHTPLPKRLQAHSTKQFIPDTEIDMLQQNAVPASDDEIKALRDIISRRHSMQYRLEELKMPTKTLAEITGSRIRLAYRLVRYMSHIRGIGGVGQPLLFSTASSNSQVNLLEIPLPYNPSVGWYRGLASVRNLLAEVSEADYHYTYILAVTDPATGETRNQIYSTKGMSILPPPLHDKYFPNNGQKNWQYRRKQHTPEWYSPLSDGPLNTYLNMVEFLVRHLGIDQSSNLEDQAAATALLNPAIARLAWPCRDDIETYEEYVLLPYLNRIAVEKSPIEAIEEVKKALNLTHAEAFDFMETAKTYGEQAFTYDASRERALMINKLHGLASDCSDAGMVTTQLNSFKTIAQILGLTKHEEEVNIDRRETLAGVLEAEVLEAGVLEAEVIFQATKPELEERPLRKGE